MVNKAAFGVGVIVLLAAVGIGVLIGMQIGGASGTGLATPGEETATPTSERTAIPTATTTPTATGTPTPTATAQYTDVPARTFNEQNVSEYILQYLNERRQAAGLDTLSASGSTSDRLHRMAERHSDAMAREGRVIHTIDGQSSADRYRDNNLYGRCEMRSAGGGYIESADNNRFEAIGHTVAGQPYTDDGQRRFHGNDSQVARALVTNWNDSDIYHDRLTLENANRVGIGVEVTNTGNVYATVNVCS
ncbi:CAP domain-containing protein [Halomicroarcula sp. GCM10025709]|uniref:CAP domain-containing protein n=1 Tax=Haloarcula TaxID=2237 RepID=UPI0024C46B8F|nr:CAP domain-containing protein [Halomicroarcula sp. YJ-61-S]